jgi:hypothetical protein
MGFFGGGGAAPANMGGATSSAAGTAGLVPAPAAGDQDKVLRGDATFDFNFNPSIKRWGRMIYFHHHRIGGDQNTAFDFANLASGTGAQSGTSLSTSLSSILQSHQFFDCGTGASGYISIQWYASNGIWVAGPSTNTFAMYLKLDALPSADNDVKIYVGFQNSNSATLPTHGAYFKLTNASSNWRCVHASTTESDNDSGITADTSAHTFKIVTDTSKTSKFYIDNVLVNTHSGTLTTDQGGIYVPYSAKRASSSSVAANIRMRSGWLLFQKEWSSAIGVL